MIGCGPNPDPGGEPINVSERFVGEWKVSVVTLDGVRKTSFDNARLTISSRVDEDVLHFSFSGAPDESPLPAVGTFKFGINMNIDLILVDPKQDIVYTVTDNVLELTMAAQPIPNVNIVPSWVFVFARSH